MLRLNQVSYASPSTDRSNSMFLPWGRACRFWFDPASEALRLLHESRSCRNPLQNLWQAILELIGFIEQDLPWLLRRVASKGLAISSNAYYRVLSIRPSNSSCTYNVISSISYVCDGGKEVLRLTWCLLPKKCGMPASKVLWSFRQSCTLASSASGLYGIQFLDISSLRHLCRPVSDIKRIQTHYVTMCMNVHDTSWYIMQRSDHRTSVRSVWTCKILPCRSWPIFGCAFTSSTP